MGSWDNIHHKMTTQSEVLPRELRLGAPPTMPQARSYLFKQKSTLNTYSEKSVIQINIPRLQRSYLTNDSYLQFTVSMKANPGYINTSSDSTKDFVMNMMLCADTPGGYSFIDKIEVYDYLGSTLLESTAGHGQLMALLLDATSPGYLQRKLGVNAGTGKVNLGNNQYMAGYGVADVTTTRLAKTQQVSTLTSFGPVSGQPFEFLQSSSGFYTDPNGTIPIVNEETIQKEFSIPLLSFLGLLSPKYVPLHNVFTINITLNSRSAAMGLYNMSNNASSTDGSEVAVGTLTAGSFAVTDVFYCAQVLELGPVAESMLLSSTQGNPLIVHSKAYRNFVNYIEKGTNTFRFDLNLNVASMTSILWFMRPTFNLSSANDQYCRTLSQRIRNFLTSWYFQYGSSILPQTTGIKAMTSSNYDARNRSGRGGSECFVELMKALRKNNVSTDESCFTDTNYNVDVQQDGTFTNGTFTPSGSQAVVDSPPPLLIPGARPQIKGNDPDVTTLYNVSTIDDVGRFACGLNLQLSPEHSYEVVSGLNTNGMNTSINATFASTQITNQQQVQVDAYCEYDAFINITPGLASTVSF